jgi:tRNA (guanine-N(7)-)-methyltransferase subunit TRM82
VSALHIPPSASDVLVSGGGDPALRIWDWHTGRARGQIPVLAAVRPHIAVLPRRGKAPVLTKDGRPNGRKSRKRARQLAAAQAAENVNDAEGDADADVDAGEGSSAPLQADDTINEPQPGDAPPEPVLAIQRITSFSPSSGRTTLLFSATGFAHPSPISSPLLTRRRQSCGPLLRPSTAR